MSKTYIGREAALNKLRQIRDDYRSRYNGTEAAAIAEYCRDALIDIPTAADVEEVRHGQWLNMGDFEQCSVCFGTHLKEFQSFYGTVMWVKTPFCPNCGAKMTEEEK